MIVHAYMICFQLSMLVGFILSYSIQETLRLAIALGAFAFVHRFFS